MGSSSENMTSKGCCLRRVPCIVPILAFIFVLGIFAAIIIVSEVDNAKKILPWKEGILIGNGFRTEAMKIVVPFLRRCDGPKLIVSFFTSEDNIIPSTFTSPNPCGSLLQNLFGSQATEVVLYTVNSSSDKIHDYVSISVVNSNGTSSSSLPEAQSSSVSMFSVCIFPKFRFDGKIEVEEFSNIPEIATFFESWLFYGATEFFVYDLLSPQNESYNSVYDLYKDVTVIRPFENDKTLISEKFSDANLFYSFDCLYRSRYRSNFAVLTTFEEIPVVKTTDSLQNSLVLMSSSINQQEANSVFQLSNYKAENLTTTIFNPLEIDSFTSSGSTVSKVSDVTPILVPPELVETFSILQLSSVLFQQPKNSSMYQVFDSWIRNYDLRVNDFNSG
ncbi:hypothetical protein FO519_009554 [Halicephalobus sp. NKZ332]|nr:hypothetical protein FO519_009554 [Halicephalobus sp. NKZ332]